MAKTKAPVTAAVRVLRANKVDFTDHLYSYEEHGGTAVSARELGVDEHSVVKTLVFEDDAKQPLIVLMHGDFKVSARQLARMEGGTSPFGTRKTMPVYMEETVLDLERIFINGGKRGYLVGMKPRDVQRILDPVLVRVGITDP